MCTVHGARCNSSLCHPLQQIGVQNLFPYISFQHSYFAWMQSKSRNGGRGFVWYFCNPITVFISLTKHWRTFCHFLLPKNRMQRCLNGTISLVLEISTWLSLEEKENRHKKLHIPYTRSSRNLRICF